MKSLTIYNIKVNDTGVLNSTDLHSFVMEINAPFVIVILCQRNSLMQEKDHFNKTTITMIIVCMPFTSSCLQNEHFPANRKGF